MSVDTISGPPPAPGEVASLNGALPEAPQADIAKMLADAQAAIDANHPPETAALSADKPAPLNVSPELPAPEVVAPTLATTAMAETSLPIVVTTSSSTPAVASTTITHSPIVVPVVAEVAVPAPEPALEAPAVVESLLSSPAVVEPAPHVLPEPSEPRVPIEPPVPTEPPEPTPPVVPPVATPEPSVPPTAPTPPDAPLVAPTLTLDKPGDLKIAFVNESANVEARSRDIPKAELTGKRSIAKRIWDGVSRPFQEQTKTERTEKQMIRDQTLFGNDDAGKAAQKEYRERELERFMVSDILRYSEEAGEKRTELGETADEAGAKLMIQEVLNQYVKGELDDANFEEARGRLQKDLVAKFPELAGRKDLMFCDNLLDVAKQVMLREETEEARLQLIQETEIILAQSRGLQRTEVKYSGTDKLVELMEKIPRIGKVVLANEAAVAVGLSVAMSVITMGGQKVAGLARLGVVGLGSAAYAGMRERKQYSDKRQQHLRESAVGEIASPEDKQREKLERTRYATETATDLQTKIRADLLFERGPDGQPLPLTAERFREVAAGIADVKARLALSDVNNIDLIAFSSVDKVMIERDDLIMSVTQTEEMLRRAAEADPALKAEVLATGELKDLIATEQAVRANFLTQDIEGKDEVFRSQRRRAVIKKMAIAGATGVVIGSIFQEVKAFAGGSSVGVLENHTSGGSEHDTLLRRVLRNPFEHRAPTGHTEPMTLGSDDLHHKLTLPDGVRIESGSNGEYSVFRGTSSKPILEHIRLKEGGIDADSAKRLHDAGFNIGQTSEQIKGTNPGVDTVQTAKEYVGANGQRVKRDWMNNNTRKFDRNELRLDLEVGPDGHVYAAIPRMRDGGSFHNRVQDQVGAMKAGDRGKLLISPTKSTQATPKVFDFKDNRADLGDVKDNPWVHMVNGRPKLMAQYAEVGDPTGPPVNGVQHFNILATDVGHGVDSIRVAGVPTESIETHYKTVIDALPQTRHIDLPPFFPIPTYTRLDATTRPTPPIDGATILPGEPGVPSPMTPEVTPLGAETLTLWQLKEEALKAVAEMADAGVGSPEELRQIRLEIGRIDQNLKTKNLVAPTDLLYLTAIFTRNQASEEAVAERQAAADIAGGMSADEANSRRDDTVAAGRRGMQVVMNSMAKVFEEMPTQTLPDGKKWEYGENAEALKVRQGPPPRRLAATAEPGSRTGVTPPTPVPTPSTGPTPSSLPAEPPTAPPAGSPPAEPPVGPPIVPSEPSPPRPAAAPRLARNRPTRESIKAAAEPIIAGYRTDVEAAIASGDVAQMRSIRQKLLADDGLYYTLDGDPSGERIGYAVLRDDLRKLRNDLANGIGRTRSGTSPTPSAAVHSRSPLEAPIRPADTSPTSASEAQPEAVDEVASSPVDDESPMVKDLFESIRPEFGDSRDNTRVLRGLMSALDTPEGVDAYRKKLVDIPGVTENLVNKVNELADARKAKFGARLAELGEPRAVSQVEPAAAEPELDYVQRLATQVNLSASPEEIREKLANTFKALGDIESVDAYRDWFKNLSIDDEYHRVVDELADAKLSKF